MSIVIFYRGGFMSGRGGALRAALVAKLFTVLMSLTIVSSGCNRSVLLSGLSIDTAPESAPQPSPGPSSKLISLPNGMQISSEHPRVFITKQKFEEMLPLMNGPKAKDPYKRWFNLLKQSQDSGTPVQLPSLAILYKVTGDISYLSQLISRIPLSSTSGAPSIEELRALDLVFDDIPDSTKWAVMKRASDNPDGFYYGAVGESNSSIKPSWGYHRQGGVAVALLYSGVFAGTDYEMNKDANIHRFDAHNFLTHVKDEFSPSGGYFWNIENRIAGSPQYNTALPGSFGGMFDNFGYDSSLGEEGSSILSVAEFSFLTGEDHYSGFLHEQARASFYQNMQYPYLNSKPSANVWCHRAGDEWHTVARIWNTQTDYIQEPPIQNAPLVAWLYQDSRMQHFVNHGTQIELCGVPYNYLYMDLLFYDDTLEEEGPASNPTASYFSGPGLVSMRASWENDAAFGVFMAGEAISRRYEDAGSFLLGRKVDVIVQGGARIRGNVINERAHWYHIRSASKNTLKIFDPLERFDIDPVTGATLPLHAGGWSLVGSDNLGGQIFDTALSSADGCIYAPDGNTSSCSSRIYRKEGSAFPENFGIYERADIIKYEHRPAAFTYTVGDLTASYTRKIDFFDREFLYLRPDIFIIFDRVQSVDPEFKKVWVAHTMDSPVPDGIPAPLPPLSLGMSAFSDSRKLLISNPKNNTQMSMLLPESNRVVIRGGDTMLVSPRSLNSGITLQGADGAPLAELDIPRWLELFAVGATTTGSVTITGEAESVQNTLAGDGQITQVQKTLVAATETVSFQNKHQLEVSGDPSYSVTTTTLTDLTQNWIPDQWRGYRLWIRGPELFLTITSNTSNTLTFAEVPNLVRGWAYQVDRPVANTTKLWKKIDSITAQGLDVGNFSVSVPHYFDTEDALGRLHSFVPHSDATGDTYKKRKELGQYTINIEASIPKKLDQFLNVLALRDPSVPMPSAQLLKSVEANASGALLTDSVTGRTFVLFGNSRDTLSAFQVNVGPGAARGVICDLAPNALYSVEIDAGGLLQVAPNSAGGAIRTSSMGILSVQVSATGEISSRDL